MVAKQFPLLAAIIFTQHCYGRKLPCEIPNDSEGAFSFIIKDRKLFYFCSNETKDLKVSTCQKGQWEPSVEENCLNIDSGHHQLFLTRDDFSRNRFRRSPNVGKFESLKRRERVQRKIKSGLLATKIEPNTPTIVRVHPGNRAFLLCRIENLGTNSVLWSKQSRVLSIDTLRITDDARFLPSHDEATRTWTLEVTGIRLIDEGDYVCQVNTRPPLKHFVSLQVIPHGVPLLPPITQGVDGSRIDDIDQMRANISAVWSEINRLSEMVNTHVQDGHHHHLHSHKSHDNDYHHHGNETMEEIDQLDEHSNHTHEVGRHYDDQHFHQEHFSDEHAGHHHRHTEERGHNHHHDDERIHSHHHDEERGHDHHHDDKRDHHSHVHKTQSHDDNSDEDDSRGSHPYGYKGKDHHQSHHHNPHESHSHHRKHHHYHHSDESGSAEYFHKNRKGLVFKAPGIGTHRQPDEINETEPQGSCVMKPNTDIPESRIVGKVVVLQRKYGKGPLYYKINLQGFSVGKDKRSRSHGFHIHENALTGEGLCGSAGAHFNPLNQTHGPISSKKRHLGDFGNIVVDKEGSILDFEVTDHSNSLNNIIAKSFVIHELPDDLGKGGNPESLATGNAGRRLACCTIHAGIDMSIRFNG